ncbi:bifunctional ornithine acetyltransferase/N-acetylglutamate synthase [Caldalkalibacillus salinus]|uniref:bifunctional ornithine acetyltransferase/N-acetylglutamate synthase n=1 Tax=Caldalkalibacillus salinus TaxID=2803787 RepID=UPI0019228D83|nr:bifunctional ornithine acetyltransferase/N-acetylglutamate synthase [Caldalkalibacillus salinus]
MRVLKEGYTIIKDGIGTEVQDTLEQQGISIIPEGSITLPKGYESGGLHCGLKFKRKDIGWIVSHVPAQAAGVYTTNAYQAAPLQVTQESIAQEGKLQAVVVNSANANACTGPEGLEDAYAMRTLTAQQFGVPEHYAAIVSTGVIGERLDMDKVRSGIEEMDQLAHAGVANFEKAILTTDTCTKSVAVQCEIDGQTVSIGGVAKGSGMVHPNMATMLAFITTDANIEQTYLQNALKQATDHTFNRITVDGDTSTNDMVLLLANGEAGNDPLTLSHEQHEVFLQALIYVCEALAKMIARDGEGASKLIEVTVKGAQSEAEAEQIGKAVVGSSLVKTAVYGTDPNWGRIICAVGYSGQTGYNPDHVSVHIGPIEVVHEGRPTSFSEEEAKRVLEHSTVSITVDLHAGTQTATCWGCDLTYDYVRINASYRT